MQALSILLNLSLSSFGSRLLLITSAHGLKGSIYKDGNEVQNSISLAV